jgi:molybdenum ABC transporter ATP-binding protein
MISIRDLSVELGDFTLKNASLEIADGEYMVILGPTGAGKTVLLESIAGLYPIKHGQVWLRGKEVTKLEPDKRKISIVYQDHALFPHLSVKENIVFGLKVKKTAYGEIEKSLDQVVNLLGIRALLNRRPSTLSGGERQKVAMARALCVRPDVLLLDEPLSALDPQTREEVQYELRQLQRLLHITALHVTHDFEEAIALGDRIAVIGDGEVKQIGTPEEIFRQPNSEFVARFAMSRNIFPGVIEKSDSGDCLFKTSDTKLIVASENNGATHATVRPEDVLISIDPLRSSARNTFTGKITRITDKGSTLYITVDLPPEISALITRNSFRELELVVGMQVYVTFKASSVHVF